MAGAASAQSASSARDPVNRADLACMTVAAAAVGQVEEGSVEQLGLVAAMTYYLGRLETRAPEVNWLDQMQAYAEGDIEEEFKTQGERCAGEMMAFGTRLTEWGERAEALAAKQEGAGKGHPQGYGHGQSGKREP